MRLFSLAVNRFNRAAMVVGICAALTACGGNTLLNEADEARIGAEQHPRVLKTYGGAYDNPLLAAYVEAVMKKVAVASDRPDIAYRITILNTDEVNAFALPGGYVYVTRGLLALANNEAQLAAVIGHEIGHVTARHSARRHTSAVGVAVLAGVLGTALQAAGTGVNASTIDTALNLGGSLALAKYGRNQEYEADEIGVRTSRRAGYDAHGQAEFLELLDRYTAYIAAQKGGRKGGGWLASHPNTPARVARAHELATAQPASAPASQKPIKGRRLYLNAIDGLAFGASAQDNGTIRARYFLHSGLQLQFEVPPGFVLENAPNRVMARHANGLEMVFDIAPRLQGGLQGGIQGQTPKDYLTKKWARRLTPNDVRAINVNGRAAAEGYIREASRHARLLVIAHDETQWLRFVMFSPPNLSGQAQSAMNSLRRSVARLSPAQARRLEAHRVRIVLVQRGDSISSLARRMKVGAPKQQLFMVLNDLDENDVLQVGQSVKLIE